MAIRRFTVANDNTELYGKMMVDNPTRPSFLYPIGFQPQFGIISLTQAYLKNPYWFGKSDIFLHKLSSGNLEYQVGAQGHGLLFSYDDNACYTLSQNAWRFIGDSEDTFSRIETFYPTNKQLYLIYSQNESIFGQVCSIQENLEDIEVLGDSFFQSKQLFLVDKVDNYSGLLEPMVFSKSEQEDKQVIFPVEEYTFFEEEGQLYLLFNNAMKTPFKLVLFKSENPSISLKSPDGITENGLYIEHKNFPYSHMELSYRIK